MQKVKSTKRNLTGRKRTWNHKGLFNLPLTPTPVNPMLCERQVFLMDEKEKYRAEMETRLLKFHDTYSELKTLMERKKDAPPDVRVEVIPQKHEKATAHLKKLENSDQSSYQKFKKELDEMADDIDGDLRKALAYFG
jgi:DNA-directed RNA polymerase subunit F